MHSHGTRHREHATALFFNPCAKWVSEEEWQPDQIIAQQEQCQKLSKLHVTLQFIILFCLFQGGVLVLIVSLPYRLLPRQHSHSEITTKNYLVSRAYTLHNFIYILPQIEYILDFMYIPRTEGGTVSFALGGLILSFIISASVNGKNCDFSLIQSHSRLPSTSIKMIFPVWRWRACTLALMGVGKEGAEPWTSGGRRELPGSCSSHPALLPDASPEASWGRQAGFSGRGAIFQLGSAPFVSLKAFQSTGVVNSVLLVHGTEPSGAILAPPKDGGGGLSPGTSALSC